MVVGRLAAYQLVLLLCCTIFLYRWTQLKSRHIDYPLPAASSLVDFQAESSQSLSSQRARVEERDAQWSLQRRSHDELDKRQRNDDITHIAKLQNEEAAAVLKRKLVAAQERVRQHQIQQDAEAKAEAERKRKAQVEAERAKAKAEKEQADKAAAEEAERKEQELIEAKQKKEREAAEAAAAAAEAAKSASNKKSEHSSSTASTTPITTSSSTPTRLVVDEGEEDSSLTITKKPVTTPSNDTHPSHHQKHQHDHSSEMKNNVTSSSSSSSSSSSIDDEPSMIMPSEPIGMETVEIQCHTTAAPATVTRPNKFPTYRYKQYHVREEKEEIHEHSPSEYPQFKECNELRSKYGIVPGKSWGNAPPDVQKIWSEKVCDEPWPDQESGAHHEKGKPFGGRKNTYQTLAADIDRDSMPADAKWIVFLSPMTTSHTKTPITSPAQIPFWPVLFDYFLAKSSESLHNQADPYYYSFFVGYDVGDPILDKEENVRWILDELHCRLDHAGIGRHKVGIRFFAMSDTVHAPSWGVSHLAHAAYDLGADYFYQINDDVEMKTEGWEQKLIGALQSTCNFGVTGPTDESNHHILTQSFTHRTHIEVFGYYFAMPFQNWWSDDWISGVYTSPYTHRGHGVIVKHRTDKVGQRYPVTRKDHLLHREIADGQVKLKEWLTNKKAELKCASNPSPCYCKLKF